MIDAKETTIWRKRLLALFRRVKRPLRRRMITDPVAGWWRAHWRPEAERALLSLKAEGILLTIPATWALVEGLKANQLHRFAQMNTNDVAAALGLNVATVQLLQGLAETSFEAWKLQRLPTEKP